MCMQSVVQSVHVDVILTHPLQCLGGGRGMPWHLQRSRMLHDGPPGKTHLSCTIQRLSPSPHLAMSAHQRGSARSQNMYGRSERFEWSSLLQALD